MMTTRLPILQVLQNYRNMAAYLMKGREESSMHLYSMKYGNDQIQSTQGAVHHICPVILIPMKSLDLFCAFSPQLFSLFHWTAFKLIGFEQSNDQSPPHCRMVSLKTMNQPGDSMGPSFVHPCCVCLLTWQLSAGQEQPWYAITYCPYEFSNAFNHDNFCS